MLVVTYSLLQLNEDAELEDFIHEKAQKNHFIN